MALSHKDPDYGVVIANECRLITHVNEKFTLITGYSHRDAIGKNCSFLQGRETNNHAVRILRDCLNKRQRCQVALLNYRKDGTPFWNCLTIFPMLNSAGQITTFVGSLQVKSVPSWVDAPMARLPWLSSPSWQQHAQSAPSSPPQPKSSRFRRTRTVMVDSMSGEDEHAPRREFPKVSFISETALPTRKGVYRVRAYHISKKSFPDTEIICVMNGTVENGVNVPCRVHDQCFTSEVLGSLKCDCREQLEWAMDYIKDTKLNPGGTGMIIYMPQEGRGIGLGNKIKAYQMQELGLDTVDANRVLGFPDDLRDYSAVPAILTELGIKSIQLMTNNPRKIEELRAVGVGVTKRIPIVIEANPFSNLYLLAKKHRMGHHLGE